MGTSLIGSNLSSELRQKKQALLDRLAASDEKDDGADTSERAPFVIIMGNEAGDTDSMSSAILLSELLSADSKDNELARKFPRSTTFVPLMQLPRKDLALRAENEYLLQMAELDPQSLVFLDDLPEPASLKRADVFFGITDHPRLSSYWQPQRDFQDRVQIVVDHHADDHAHPKARIRVLKGPENGAIASAVSVVVDLFRGSREVDRLSPALADLALAALLIDTDDLRPVPKGKATDVDISAAKILLAQSSVASENGQHAILSAANALDTGTTAEEIQGQSNSAIGRVSEETRTAASAFHLILSAKKLDVSRLDGHDLLRRDYKESSMQIGEGQSSRTIRAGFSSVPVGLSDWIHQRHGDDETRWDAFWGVLRAWMKERRLDVAVVGTSFRETQSANKDGVASSDNEERNAKEGKHRRELIMACLEPADGAGFYKNLVSSLESETYSSSLGNDPAQRLDLDTPWKGTWRVPSTGKKERVGGLDKQGRWHGLHEAGLDLKLAVWRQRNGRASRKVYLPAVMHALKAAAAVGAKGKV